MTDEYQEHKGLFKMMGIRNGLITTEDKCFVVFYDIDREITDIEKDQIDIICRLSGMSYLMYKTKHGYHVIGLTPVDSIVWGYVFKCFRSVFHSDYIGQTIRLSRKIDEVQYLICKHVGYGEVIPNLYNAFATKLKYDKIPCDMKTLKYRLVFETYWTAKR